jgi:hypothetical protein
MKKFVFTFMVLAGCQKAVSQPVVVCTPASKGMWLYNANKISVCAPDGKTHVYGWQELKWQEQPKEAAAPAAPTQRAESLAVEGEDG